MKKRARPEPLSVELSIGAEPIDLVSWTDRYVGAVLELEGLQAPRPAEPPVHEDLSA